MKGGSVRQCSELVMDKSIFCLFTVNAAKHDAHYSNTEDRKGISTRFVMSPISTYDTCVLSESKARQTGAKVANRVPKEVTFVPNHENKCIL